MDDGRVRETAETAGCGEDDGRDYEEFRLTENERLDCDELGLVSECSRGDCESNCAASACSSARGNELRSWFLEI